MKNNKSPGNDGLTKVFYITFWKSTFSTGNRKNLSQKQAVIKLIENDLPEIISPNQNAYVKNRCVSERGRLISDLLEMSFK